MQLEIKHYTLYLRYQRDRHEYYVGQTLDIDKRNQQFHNTKIYAGTHINEAREKDRLKNGIVDPTKWQTFIIFQGYCTKYEIDIREKRAIHIMYELCGETNLLNNKKDFPKDKDEHIINDSIPIFFNQSPILKNSFLSSPVLITTIIQHYM